MSYPGYGTAAGTKYSTFLQKNTGAHGVQQQRFNGVLADGEDPPKYFELDPNAVTSTNDGGNGYYMPQENGHVTNHKAPSMPYQNDSHMMPRGNNSVQEFNPTTYDHLEKDYNENKNHKSV